MKDSSNVDDAAAAEQQIRRRRHSTRSPLQAIDTNRGDGVTTELLITPKSAVTCAGASTAGIGTCANASAVDTKRANTPKRPSNHSASFFSPPRALREPIPFLSPTVPNYKDFCGTDDGKKQEDPSCTMLLVF